MRLPCIARLLAGFSLLVPPVSAVSAVKVGMIAAFDAAPYLLELVETAAGENSSSYFPLLDRIASGYFLTASSEAELYRRFLDVIHEDGHITRSDALSTFNLALSLRSAAPRIEAHYQHYSKAMEPLKELRDCDTWVLLDHMQYCTPNLDTGEKNDLASAVAKPLPFDRSLGMGRDAILYADPTSNEFAEYHQSLSKAAHAMNLRYRLRYRRSKSHISRPLPVSGYGVELALKKTDYIVMDDRHSSKNTDQSPMKPVEVLDGTDDVVDLKPLSTSELSSIGMKAASYIKNSDHPFDALVKLTQDFPRFASSIASQNVSQAFAAENKQNRAQKMPGGVNFLWMNGAQLTDREIQPFALANMLRSERKLVDGIRDLGFDGEQAVALLSHKAVSTIHKDDKPLRYDWTDRLEAGGVILWLNDLENDERYISYPKTLTSLLQLTFPGQIPPIGRNVFNLVIPADLSDAEDLQFISEVEAIIDRGVPIRFGLVPLQLSDEAKTQAKIAYFLTENYGIESTISYIKQLAKAQQKMTDSGTLLSTITESRTLLPGGESMSLSMILQASDFTEKLVQAGNWARRLKADTAVRPLFMNGILVPRDQNWMQSLGMKVSGDLQTIQRGIFHGVLDDDTWTIEVFLEGAVSRRNIYISETNEKALRVLNIAKIYDENADMFNAVPIVDSSAESTTENWAVVTVLADMSSRAGLDILLSALEFRRSNPAVRLDFINTQADFKASSQVNRALKANQAKFKEIVTIQELEELLREASDYDASDNFAASVAEFLAETKIPTGSQVVIMNGRVIGPIAAASTFNADDFEQLLEYEQTRRILPVHAAVAELGLSERISDSMAAAKLSSIVALSALSDFPEGIFESSSGVRSTIYTAWNSSHTGVESGDPKKSSIHIVGLLDPVSEKSQKWVYILRVLAELDGVYVKLFLNPKELVEELPVKRFFRYVIESTPKFDENGSVKDLTATFSGLPLNALMTVGMDVPPAWLVAPKSSVHDLDNIQLSAAKSDIEATYELQHILIEGHSRDDQESAPRGAQLVLATENEPHLTDTIVMANLGFFQFKANPGVYNIRLKEGRSAEIFTIESIGAQGWESAPDDKGNELALMDFQGTTLYPRLKRRPGMENQDVLEDTSNSSKGSMVSKSLKFAEGLLSGGKGKSTSDSQHAEINIFSVASGHLYERMLNIMMVSVMRNTKHSVKFWFIEQFLSPSFKEFIPHLANEYGFKYEMITYKWPHWLRQQKEKQREIWGYKILFLDVLFPLSLDKVIFVDADQIVRTDMMDLVNLDLNGAPYGFTPMCDSRTEMEGFRFWKQGYWANYLRGRPYHISALYVVDLRRFRELAAGDRLRQQYHALSADPASLSNLDQDLPNHMQFQIPIHSLSQDWLWCETWCSDESLAKARTIDLCNNPQTKEPKLDRARRQVPEWTMYDQEIAALDLKRKQRVQSEATETDRTRSEDGEAGHHHSRDEL
ncbi:UDP-glucose:glycoprotein glucosyltransferase precursor [Metarhizium album ARSEF 1941]|uniref:UDP-glucose:glycoprotein glucosyltransferase n=1 Tax=Metarhizium album (strain ARSEF 1941) TaxID=1081103 RepID=A0A0B2X6P9_METAS|nr:UDP-glucose:glycoprotein glucosyltransferase precursor [Metarhizium album ARSEF 1941]KHO01145.1 UDP-glucose:glycoprotein glucosyltransferase precursor [Metarhizium album ARSEF 1941]